MDLVDSKRDWLWLLLESQVFEHEAGPVATHRSDGTGAE